MLTKYLYVHVTVKMQILFLYTYDICYKRYNKQQMQYTCSYILRVKMHGFAAESLADQ